MNNTNTTKRPQRLSLTDSLGRKRTLYSGPQAFDQLEWGRPDDNGALLLLGLGPEPEQALELIRARRRSGLFGLLRGAEGPVAFVESPEFERGMRDSLGARYIDALHQAGLACQRLSQAEALEFFVKQRPTVLRYQQGLRLFPEFWGPFQAALRAKALSFENAGEAGQEAVVLLPGTDKDLLHRELHSAFRKLGLKPVVMEDWPEGNPRAEEELQEILRRDKPSLLFSVNLRGLDRAGERFHLLQAMGVAVALWFVDNPWNILSSLRQPWWREASLFVTDESFVPQLMRHGARHAYHLPLGSSGFFDAPQPAPLRPGTRLLFVGHSAFPRRDKFFAAVPKGGLLKERAEDMLRRGERPDFNWWVEQGLISRLWPGNEVRFAAWGAEYAALSQRSLWLNAAAPHGLCVIGDDEWKRLLPPGVEILPPVDYYQTLPGLYRAAPYTLNVSSLLLPAGLTQRNFDVWRAGGFLLSAPSNGLEIFPLRLTEPITIDRPEDLPQRMAELDADPLYKENLRQEWQKYIINEHSYETRIKSLLSQLRLLDLIAKEG